MRHPISRAPICRSRADGRWRFRLRSRRAIEAGMPRSHGPKRKRPLAAGVNRLLQCSYILRGGVLAGDAVDLEAGNAEIVELAVRQERQLTDGFAITQVSADFGEDVGHEHGEPPLVG